VKVQRNDDADAAHISLGRAVDDRRPVVTAVTPMVVRIVTAIVTVRLDSVMRAIVVPAMVVVIREGG